MSLLIPFLPTQTQPFQFTPTLDGIVYQASVTWNVFGQRWYLNLSTQNGALVLSRALVGSPASYDIDLLAGLGFDNTLVYRPADGVFEVGP